MRNKSGVKLLVSFILVLVMMNFVSAGFFDFLTGHTVVDDEKFDYHNVLKEGENININGNTFSIVYISEDSVKLNVNGQITDMMKVGDKTSFENFDVTVTDIIYSSKDADISMVQLGVNFNKEVNKENNIKDDDAILGNKDAKVTIVEFGDYEAPYNSKFYSQVLPKIKLEYIDTGKVNFIFRDFPLSFHQNAQGAAEAAECAGEQNKYYEMHNQLFENGVDNGTDMYKLYAKKIDLNVDKFSDCLILSIMREEVEKDIEDGKNRGVKSVPSFFINGEFIAGSQPFDTFREIIDKKLNEEDKNNLSNNEYTVSVGDFIDSGQGWKIEITGIFMLQGGPEIRYNVYDGNGNLIIHGEQTVGYKNKVYEYGPIKVEFEELLGAPLPTDSQLVSRFEKAKLKVEFNIEKKVIGQTITEPGIYTIKDNDKIKMNDVNINVISISWALQGDTVPKVMLQDNRAVVKDLEAGKSATFQYGSLLHPISNNLIIEVLSINKESLMAKVKITKINEVIGSSQNSTEPLEESNSTEPLEESIACDGCIKEDKCYPVNNRKGNEYCNIDKNWIIQQDADTACDNNFECSSNLCVDSSCVEAGLWQKIMNWFSKLF